MFTALSHPIRCDLLTLLFQEEGTAEILARNFDVSRPAISQHLKILVDSGLARAEKRGRRVCYSAVPDALAALHRLLDLLEFPEVEERAPQPPTPPPSPKRRRYDPNKEPELVDSSVETIPEGGLEITATYQL
jgi:DNA-binding transcriptional ArsR family regulator